MPPVVLDNEVLSRLPEDERRRLLHSGRVLSLDHGPRLSAAGEPVTHVHFPLSGLVSIIYNDPGGQTLEVTMIGREGLIGVTALFGNPVLPYDVIVQLAGLLVEVPLAEARAVLADGPVFRALAGRYLSSLHIQTAQNVACNRLHDLEQRAAKWFLLTGDRVQGDRISMTQEYLAAMLGVSRPKLSLVEREFRESGYTGPRKGGSFELLDRAGLESLACECYRIIRTEIRALDQAQEESRTHRRLVDTLPR